MDRQSTIRDNKRAFTLSEAAEFAGVSRGMVLFWLTSGQLNYLDLPGRGKGIYRNRRIRRVDLDDFLGKYYHTARPDRQSKVSDSIILLPRTP